MLFYLHRGRAIPGAFLLQPQRLLDLLGKLVIIHAAFPGHVRRDLVDLLGVFPLDDF